MKHRLEQIRQASRIHGSLVNMWGAALGVRAARIPIPSRWLRRTVYKTIYGRKYTSLDESELEKPLEEFRSLNELFTRGVPSALRPLPRHADNAFLSPCDSTVQEIGHIGTQTVLVVKGTEYRLSSLVPGIAEDRFVNGRFAVLFLSPADCHRVYSPQAGCLTSMMHVPGSRLLVHPTHQSPSFPVFTLNERLILNLSTSLGDCILVMVAGWGVGHITHPFPVELRPHRTRMTRHTFRSPRRFCNGEWLATFELGSTVILIIPPAAGPCTDVLPGSVLKARQPVFVQQALNAPAGIFSHSTEL